MRSVPVMSDGMRSGVNWMRENLRSSACAMVWMRSVFASPGTPTMRQLPPAKSAVSTCSITASCPMIRLRSSVTMWSRPCFRREARSVSVFVETSGDASDVMRFEPLSSHPINDVVDGQLVGVISDVHWPPTVTGPLHVVSDVVVVIDHHHQRLLWIVVLVDAKKLGSEIRVVRILHVERRNPEEDVEHGMRDRETVDAGLGKHATDLRLEVRPLAAHEVVDDEEPAFLQILPQSFDLGVRRVPVPRFRQIRDRVAEERRIVERVDVAPFDVWQQRGQLAHHREEVALHLRIVELPSASSIHGVANPGERKSPVVRHIWLDRDAEPPIAPSLPLRVRRSSEPCQCERECQWYPQSEIRNPHLAPSASTRTSGNSLPACMPRSTARSGRNRRPTIPSSRQCHCCNSRSPSAASTDRCPRKSHGIPTSARSRDDDSRVR